MWHGERCLGKIRLLPITPQTNSYGLVRPWERGRSFELHHRPPSPQLDHIVDRLWMARWDLRGCNPFRQETLPHPSINLVIEPDSGWIWGVPTKRDIRMLDGQGWAIGAKFLPGAFTACTSIEASRLTDDRMSVHTAFPHLADSIALNVHDVHTATPESILAAVDTMLTPLATTEDPRLDLIAEIIASMHDLAPDARVADIAADQHLAPRTLQRLFQRYVGVSPKWVLTRLRVHQAVEQLSAHIPPDWTELALQLGYYDHAHFIRDFRLVVGRSPARYAAEAALARQP
jgi:AraC-like DNA-binding protein